MFLIIRRAIVIEAKASYRNSVQGKQNFPGTRDQEFLVPEKKKSPYSDTRFLKFWTSKMLILGRKTSKIALFEKMLILGRRTFQSRVFSKKFQAQKIRVKILIVGVKA